MPENDINLKTLLITGAAGGIGRATVHHFAGKGWQVIGVDRAAYGDDFPANGLFIQSDISIGENLESIFLQARSFTDRLNACGDAGWELVSVFDTNLHHGATRNVIAVLKRPIQQIRT